MAYRLITIINLRIRRHFKIYACIVATLVVAALLFIVYFSIAPSGFPDKEIVTVKKGTYMSQAADILAKQGVIKSPLLFKAYVVLLTGHRQVQAGDYLFDSPQSALRVAYRTAYGIQGLPKIRVTFFEGMTVKDMGTILKRAIPQFDLQTFLALAKPEEGYLFPDTYFFYENTTPADVVNQLRSTFIDKTKPLLLDIQAFGKSASDIVTMASIVEREATSTTDRRIIAGILWKRIRSGMPLQVDPTFYYILGKDSASLTLSDLAVDSPYNLYKHTGLPPTPIDNPGLNAILDTVNPTATDYFFYLSDKNGRMHYAATLDGHTANANKYIE